MIATQPLLSALDFVAPVAKKSVHHPVPPIRIRVREGVLDLTASDNRIIVGASFPAESVDLCCHMPAALFRDIIKESESETVDLRLSEDNLRIDLSDGRYEIPDLIGTILPEIPEGAGSRAELYREDLAAGVEFVKRCADSEKAGLVLAGIFMESHKGACRIAATDGRVLTEYSFSCESDFSGIFPVSFLEIASKSKGDKIFLDIGTFPQVQFSDCGIDYILHGRLIEGQYPPYRNAIPKAPEMMGSFPVAALSQAVKRVSICDPLGIIRVQMEGECAKFSSFQGMAHASIELPCESGEWSFTCNSRYLLGILKNWPDETITLEYNGKNKAVTMRTPGLVSLVMPVGEG